MQRFIHRLPAITVATIVVLALAATSPAAQTNQPGERFTAFAVNLDNPGRAAAGVVEIVVSRWSTDAEHDRLLKVLREKGPDRLLDALRDNPKVGYIRTPTSLAYDLRFADKTAGEDGGEIISLMTDRPISHWEAVNRPRTIDYPFTLIELRLGPGGEGEGKLSLATKITADRNTIVLENYSAQPVLLTNVKREK
jgi:hypothetical protein